VTRWAVVRQLRQRDTWVDDPAQEPVLCGSRSLAIAIAATADQQHRYDWVRHVARGEGKRGVLVEEVAP
jgi:hypothetical protein